MEELYGGNKLPIEDRITCAYCHVTKPKEEFITTTGWYCSICKECKDIPKEPEDGKKACAYCGEIKAVEMFPIAKGKKGGRFPYCRDCNRRIYRAKNPEVKQ